MRASPKNYYVYILASLSRTLYVGVTNDLEPRVAEHDGVLTRGFTAKYDVTRLVYFEAFEEIQAPSRARNNSRDGGVRKKIKLIESLNTDWNDLNNG